MGPLYWPHFSWMFNLHRAGTFGVIPGGVPRPLRSRRGCEQIRQAVAMSAAAAVGPVLPFPHRHPPDPSRVKSQPSPGRCDPGLGWATSPGQATPGLSPQGPCVDPVQEDYGKVQPVLVSASPVDQRKDGLEGSPAALSTCPPDPLQTGSLQSGATCGFSLRMFLPPARSWEWSRVMGAGVVGGGCWGVPHTA